MSKPDPFLALCKSVAAYRLHLDLSPDDMSARDALHAQESRLLDRKSEAFRVRMTDRHRVLATRLTVLLDELPPLDPNTRIPTEYFLADWMTPDLLVAALTAGFHPGKEAAILVRKHGYNPAWHAALEALGSGPVLISPGGVEQWLCDSMFNLGPPEVAARIIAAQVRAHPHSFRRFLETALKRELPRRALVFTLAGTRTDDVPGAPRKASIRMLCAAQTSRHGILAIRSRIGSTEAAYRIGQDETIDLLAAMKSGPPA